MEEIALLRNALDRLHAALDDLVVRGLRAAGPTDLAKLKALRDEFQNAGAAHIGSQLGTIIEAVQDDNRESAARLLRTMTSARLFDRILTLEVCAQSLSSCMDVDNQDEEEA